MNEWSDILVLPEVSAVLMNRFVCLIKMRIIKFSLFVITIINAVVKIIFKIPSLTVD